jgi:hypothetical protein
MSAISYADMIVASDEWLDTKVGSLYKGQPLAQDWARISKVAEELGEAIEKFILATGQNPRKPQERTAMDDCLGELADVAWTGVLAIQHFTKSWAMTDRLLDERLVRIHDRVKP